MKSKHLQIIIDKHWKKIVIILSLLFGLISIYPALHLIPIVYNVISTRLARTLHRYESDFSVNHTTQIEASVNHIYMPLVNLSNQESANLSNENTLNMQLREIDISPTGEKITILIDRKDYATSSGSEVTISFLPGEQCNFGDGRACTFAFDLPHNTRIILSGVHSGRGGEGDSFRDMVEGTGINQGLYSTDEVLNNINELIGSGTIMSQGGTEISGLILKTIIRIPSAYIDTYLSLPIDQSFKFAQLISGIDIETHNKDLFILETCGWRLPDEKHTSSYPNSMQSIYLGVFGFDE